MVDLLAAIALASIVVKLLDHVEVTANGCCGRRGAIELVKLLW